MSHCLPIEHCGHIDLVKSLVFLSEFQTMPFAPCSECEMKACESECVLHRQPPGRSELRAEAVLRHDGAEAIRKPSPEEQLELHRPRIRLQPAVRVQSALRPAAHGRLGRGEVSILRYTSLVP